MTGDELRRLRKHKGLTLSAVASAISVTHSAVSQWESGKRRIHPAFAHLLRLYFEGKFSGSPSKPKGRKSRHREVA